MASELVANMRATTEALLRGFEGQWTLEPALAYRAPDCLHTILPKSSGVAPRSNEEFARYFKVIAPHFSQAKMTMDDYIAVPNERKVVCRSSMDAVTPVGPFHNEYVWFLTFDTSGQKVIEIVEFFDTKAASEIRAKLREAGLVPSH